MRLVTCLCLILLAAPLRAQTITLSLENAAPSSAIRALFEKAQRSFIYIDNNYSDARKITLSFENESFDTALVRVLSATQLASLDHDGIFTIKRPDDGAYSLLKALHRLQVRFAYDPLKQEIIATRDLTTTGIQQLTQLSSTRFEIRTVDEGYLLKIQPLPPLSSPLSAVFNKVRLSQVARILGVSVKPDCEGRLVSAKFDKVPLQKALEIIARLTKTVLVKREGVLCFEAVE